jgi:hypothetical protein
LSASPRRRSRMRFGVNGSTSEQASSG